MLFKTRYLHLQLTKLSHAIGETSQQLMNVSLSPEDIAKTIIYGGNGVFGKDDLLLINMPYDPTQKAQGWIAINSVNDQTANLYPYPERFANALHRSGFDYLIISGKAPEPIYIYLTDMLVLFEDFQLIKNLKPANAAEKLVGNHPWVEPEVMMPGTDSKLHFISDRYSLPQLGTLLKDKNIMAMVVDGSDETP